MENRASKYYLTSGVEFSNDYIIEKLAYEHGISVLLVVEIINTPPIRFNRVSEQYRISVIDVLDIVHSFIGLHNYEN